MSKERLKIRRECLTCQSFEGDSPENAICHKHQNPTYYRPKKLCLKREPKEKKTEIKKAIAYTDGSFNKKTRMYGYGALLIIDNETQQYSGTGFDEHNGWQIQGEIMAALTVCENALKMGVNELEIRYDYDGVKKWVTGEWQAKKKYTQDYVRKMRKFEQEMRIRFSHIKAHTGETGNESVDSIAKKACGIGNANQNTSRRIEDTAEISISNIPICDIPKDINENCRESILAFQKKVNPSFKDYSSLKTYGMDVYSRMPYCELEDFANSKALFQNCQEPILQNQKHFASVIRWILRGLGPKDALRKVKVDIQIAQNAITKR